jgi:putative transposase
VLDLYSRYVVAWMLAGRENSALAKQLFAQAISTHAIVPGQLHVHQDRGTPITAHGFIDLLNELGVDPSHSRPRVSNDNPSPRRSSRRSNTSPISPVRFRDIEHARAWCAEFFDWFNNHHQHSDLALFTPSRRISRSYRAACAHTSSGIGCCVRDAP